MKATTKDPLEDVSRVLQEKTASLHAKLDELSNKINENSSKSIKDEKDEKIANIIQNIKRMKNKIPEKPVVNNEIETKEEVKSVEHVENPVSKPETHTHDDIFCPSCQKGHVHKMESNGLKLKCADGKCGEEYFIIPKSADHTCTNCGFPIKKPADEKTLDACPFCNNNKAIPLLANGKPEIKFDFSKMKK